MQYDNIKIFIKQYSINLAYYSDDILVKDRSLTVYDNRIMKHSGVIDKFDTDHYLDDTKYEVFKHRS